MQIIVPISMLVIIMCIMHIFNLLFHITMHIIIMHIMHIIMLIVMLIRVQISKDVFVLFAR